MDETAGTAALSPFCVLLVMYLAQIRSLELRNGDKQKQENSEDLGPEKAQVWSYIGCVYSGWSPARVRCDVPKPSHSFTTSRRRDDREGIGAHPVTGSGDWPRLCVRLLCFQWFICRREISNVL